MKAVVTRVSAASVSVDGQTVSSITGGLLVLLGVAAGDDGADVAWMAGKIADLRIFGDELGRMNRSVIDSGGAVLVVSQFTLLADTRRGRRPSFIGAAPPDQAQALYVEVVTALRARGLQVSTGIFQTDMQVASVNDGPVTIVLDSRDRQ
ncbi:MAG: D-aminoacyl-tRNA deacylase [Vicinamibacterales bacterium]|jgi:D-tyrosyl-tRNA(Tyr) deacylase